MILKSSLAFVALVMSATLALAADPVGHYRVTGTGPGGGSSYSGEVTVRKTGDTYAIVWVIGRDTFVGTGVGNEEFLTVSYRSGDNTGIALYGHENDGWKGIWTYAGGTTLGTEAWARE